MSLIILLPPWSKKYTLCITIRHRLASSSPSPAAAKRQRGTASKLQGDVGWVEKKIEKIRILSKTSWEGSGGGFGGSGGSGNPVGLERLVDSMTSKLPPTTKIVFRPVLFGSGSARLVRRSKKSKKPRIMLVSTPKMPFFQGKMDIPRRCPEVLPPKLAGPWPEVHPDNFEGWSVC